MFLALNEIDQHEMIVFLKIAYNHRNHNRDKAIKRFK